MKGDESLFISSRTYIVFNEEGLYAHPIQLSEFGFKDKPSALKIIGSLVKDHSAKRNGL